MFIEATKTFALKTYVETTHRIMSVTTYWEPENPILNAATMQGIVDSAQAIFGNLIAAVVPDQVTIPTSHGVYSDGNDVQWDAYSAISGKVVGGAATILLEAPGSQVLPDVISLIIQRKTGRRGRQHAGRIFIPGIWEGFNDDGQLNDDGMTAAEPIAVFLGADATFAGEIFHSRHFNRKDLAFDVVSDCRVRKDLSTRHDREIRGIHLAF